MTNICINAMPLKTIYVSRKNNIREEVNADSANAVISYKSKEDDKEGMGIYERYSKKRTRRYYHI